MCWYKKRQRIGRRKYTAIKLRRCKGNYVFWNVQGERGGNVLQNMYFAEKERGTHGLGEGFYPDFISLSVLQNRPNLYNPRVENQSCQVL